MNCVDCETLCVGERCPDCAEEVLETPDWRPGPVSICLRGVCLVCEKILAPSERQYWRRRYCGQACEKWAKRNPGKKRNALICRGCGTSIQPPKYTWCSKTCMEVARGDRRDPALPPKVLANSQPCTEAGCTKMGFAKGLCKNHYTRQGDRKAGRTWRDRSGSPERIRQKDRMKTRRRRAKVRDPLAEDIYIDVVGDRDGWRCFCRKKIDKTKPWPHPLSPSLDHIEPLSRGGAHTYANVRIAHLRCNVDRSNRFDYEQLALFG